VRKSGGDKQVIGPLTLTLTLTLGQLMHGTSKVSMVLVLASMVLFVQTPFIAFYRKEHIDPELTILTLAKP